VKLSLRLILFLVAAVTIVTFVVSKNEVRAEKRGLRTDLVHRAEILAESLQEIVEPALEKGSREQLRHIVERFGSPSRRSRTPTAPTS
jgi:sensor histidine kinase regulating citrate/malate metabolism